MASAAKILLVEDDNNLREIFEMRLKAEGYTIVTAHDGEEALVVAMREKPDLVISDVMMPKLSGFEMIETLKASPDMKNVKVIMMTALGQAEDRAQGDKLGVDKYLVKSQVTLEDFVRVTHEVLEGTTAAAAPEPPAPTPTPIKPVEVGPVSTAPSDAPPAAPSQPTETAVPATPIKTPSNPGQAEELAAVEAQINDFLEKTPAAETTETSPPSAAESTPPAAQPGPGEAPKTDLSALADAEEDKTKGDPVVNPPAGAVLSVPPLPEDTDESPSGGVPVTVIPPSGSDSKPATDSSANTMPGVTVIPPQAAAPTQSQQPQDLQMPSAVDDDPNKVAL
mgnify:CR=1 FL=1